MQRVLNTRDKNKRKTGETMKKLSVLAVILFLAGCVGTAFYSKPATWKSPDSKVYQFTAEYGTGISGYKIKIFCNGKRIMSDSARYWAKRLTMTTTLDGKQVAAVCGGNDEAKSCVISVSGGDVVTLKF